MISLTRPSLEPAESDYLERKTVEIGESSDPMSTARTSWRTKSALRFGNIRQLLEDVAPGRGYCMYCVDSQGTAIDHFLPWTKAPNVTFVWLNYVLACSHCNSNQKRNQFPQDNLGNPLLLNPFDDEIQKHLSLDPVLGERTARTRKGIESIDIFGLNRDRLTRGRVDAWCALEVLIPRYDSLLVKHESDDAAFVLATIHRQPFLEVLAEMKRYSTSHLGLGGDEIKRILLSRPEI